MRNPIKAFIWSGLLLLLITLVLFWTGSKLNPSKQEPVHQDSKNEQFKTVISTQPNTDVETKTSQGALSVYSKWSGKRSTGLDDPRWTVARIRRQTDKKWEWRMPIEFYGKVVDESNQPIPYAQIKFVWNDLSEKGSSRSETQTNIEGLFELRGKVGKGLSVYVFKNGYKNYLSNPSSFEFAGFWEKNFYQADPNNPVVFRLRKTDNSQPLIYIEKEINNIALNIPVDINVYNNSACKYVLLGNGDGSVPWSAQIIGENCSLFPTSEEFIVEAPLTGYTTAFVLTHSTSKPPTWQGYEGGAFYLKVGELYGRIEFETLPSRDWVNVRVWINPFPGSRNLEDDPQKHINLDRVAEIGLQKAIEEVK